jgi:hypothetical protein
VTQQTFRVQPVEIPENFQLLKKIGIEALTNILVYDAWWRIVRNMRIRSLEVIRANGYSGEVPELIQSMIRWQARIPERWLTKGVISKALMAIHYISHVNSI